MIAAFLLISFFALMILGVPMEAMGINIILTAIAFLAGHSPLYLLIAPALHLVFQAICKSDHNAFRVLWLYVDTKGRAPLDALDANLAAVWPDNEPRTVSWPLTVKLTRRIV